MMEIVPYESVGEIKFGMSADDVFSILGHPEVDRRNRLQERVLYYQHHVVTVAVPGVAEVSGYPSADLILKGINVFSDPDAFKKLCRLDGEPMEHVGIITLFNIGIGMSGFHDGDEAQKMVTAFIRGYHDGFEDKMKPYEFDD